jgi:molecular chaperone GrpE
MTQQHNDNNEDHADESHLAGFQAGNAHPGLGQEDGNGDNTAYGQDPLAPTDEADNETQASREQAGSDESGRIAELENQLAESKNQLARAVAETENVRKRAAKEREDASKYAISGFAKDMLSIADNFRRALESVPDDLRGQDERVDNLITGLEATERELEKALERHNIKKLEPMGEVFDPNYHEVMYEVSAPDKQAGTVVQLMEPGYTLNERLLRPAKVGVAKDDGNNAANIREGDQIDTQA